MSDVIDLTEDASPAGATGAQNSTTSASPPALTDEELHAAIDQHLDAGGTVVLEQLRDGSPPIEHPALETVAQPAPASTVQSGLVVTVNCGTCQKTAQLVAPAGVSPRFWIDNLQGEHIARVLREQGCSCF